MMIQGPQVPSSPPPPSPSRLYGVVTVGDTPNPSAEQRIACVTCVAEGRMTIVPHAYLMFQGTSYCIEHFKTLVR